MNRREWVSMVCQGERHQQACLSWFKPFVPDDWGLPIAADVQEDVNTGRETAVRALFKLADGQLKEAVRRMNARSTKIVLRNASPAILKTSSARWALKQADTTERQPQIPGGPQ